MKKNFLKKRSKFLGGKVEFFFLKEKKEEVG
jgi:hypothetical protein